MIRLRGVSKRYRTGRREIPALDDIYLDIAEGEWLAVVGPSGCGKSTMLNLMAGIDAPDSGTIDIAGVSLTELDENELAVWRGREVGIVFQFFQLMPTLTARENVVLPMDLAGLGRDRRARADRLLERVGIASLASHLPSELSGGEQQRVAIARALANDPRLILADEPTGNLDSVNGSVVIDLLEDLWRSGTTIVMVTHDSALAARAERVISMRDGRIVDDTGGLLPAPLADSAHAYARR